MFIATRHNTHAEFAAQALSVGKCFCRKAVAISQQGIDEVESVLQDTKSYEQCIATALCWIQQTPGASDLGMKRVLGAYEQPLQMVMTMNAGHVPPITGHRTSILEVDA